MRAAVAVLFDRHELVSRCLGDGGLASELLARFAVQLPVYLERVDAAIEAGEMPEAARLAQSLGRCAGDLSAVAVVAAARQLEAALLRGDRSRALALRPALAYAAAAALSGLPALAAQLLHSPAE